MTHDVTDKHLAENEIITWIRQHPVIAGGVAHGGLDLREVAENPGDEFEYGDDSLAAWMEAFFYGDCGGLNMLFAERNSLSELRRRVAEDAFWQVDWSVVRAAILPPEQPQEIQQTPPSTQ